MNHEDWQIGFTVKGLRAPNNLLVDDKILFIGNPHDDAYIYLKVAIKNEQEKNNLRENMRIEIDNLTQMYGLMTGNYTQVQSGSVHAKISSENPFGQTKYSPDFLGFIPMPTEEQRNDNIFLLQKTVEKYKYIKEITKKKGKKYLLNAIDYYNRSLGNHNNEEKIIDLMICLESLFSRENRELRLRYSLRLSSLLGVSQQEKIPEVFRNVYFLYPKRSKIVHGTENVVLNDKEVLTFRNNLREAIKIVVHIDSSKEEMLHLLDESIYDFEKKEQLEKIVSDAVKKW